MSRDIKKEDRYIEISNGEEIKVSRLEKTKL